MLETRDGPQNPISIAIATLEENSAKGSQPLGTFSIPSEQRAKGVYTPLLVSKPKQALLAKAVAYSFLSYPALSNKVTSKGVSAMHRGCGVETYARAWTENPGFRRLVLAPATPWERRIQLLNLGIKGWQVCNPFVLYDPKTVFTPELQELLGDRFRGDNPLLQLCDEALVDSVLLGRNLPRSSDHESFL